MYESMELYIDNKQISIIDNTNVNNQTFLHKIVS